MRSLLGWPCLAVRALRPGSVVATVLLLASSCTSADCVAGEVAPLRDEDRHRVEALVSDLHSVHEGIRYGAIREVAQECMGERLFGLRFLPPAGIAALANSWDARQKSKLRALLPHFLAASSDESPDVRMDVASGLRYVGVAAQGLGYDDLVRESIERLWVLTCDRDPYVELWSARALDDMGVHGPAVVDVSVRLLEHPDPDVRAMAVYNLDILGTRAANVRAPLGKRVFDSDEEVRRLALQAFRHQRP